MLWKHYVFRRGSEVPALWDSLFDKRRSKILYVAGRGFDVRALGVMEAFVSNVRSSGHAIDRADLLLVGFTGYQLSDELRASTEENAKALEKMFKPLGPTSTVSISSSADGEDDISASNALRIGSQRVLDKVTDQTDVILDISSLPRVVYLALVTGLLQKVVGDKREPAALSGGLNLQVLVGEDAALDSQIRSEDPSDELVVIPGFSSALHVETMRQWPFVWFPILGENRVNQLQKVMPEVPIDAEICPIVPHPSRDLRRAERLLMEYRAGLFDARETPTTNILHAHESQPFEAYRQMFQAMSRYRESMGVMGGCRLVVTPLGSKLITLGAGLACFEMRPLSVAHNYGVSILYAEPKRYVASVKAMAASRPDISALLLTGDAYAT